MQKILHLSNTSLSGGPVRIMKMTNKYSKKYVARHIVSDKGAAKLAREVDLLSSEMTVDEIITMLHWADIIHCHCGGGENSNKIALFDLLEDSTPERKTILQIHSPKSEIGLPYLWLRGKRHFAPHCIVANFNPRQYPEATHILPSALDVTDPVFTPMTKPLRARPVVSYTLRRKGKGYGVVMPVLKKLEQEGKIILQIISDQTYAVSMQLKRGADIAVGDIGSGSYNMSSLEYLAMGVPCFALIDPMTGITVNELTESPAGDLPWTIVNQDNFAVSLMAMLQKQSWRSEGERARIWMEQYWSPSFVVRNYEDMYDEL